MSRMARWPVRPAESFENAISSATAVAELHHERRSPKHRHQARVGVDIGVSTLAVVADETGRVLHAHEGVKALQRAPRRA